MARTEYENVLVGRNPITGRPYFERRKKIEVDPSIPPEDPPSELLTYEELEKKRQQAKGLIPLPGILDSIPPVKK